MPTSLPPVSSRWGSRRAGAAVVPPVPWSSRGTRAPSIPSTPVRAEPATGTTAQTTEAKEPWETVRPMPVRLETSAWEPTPLPRPTRRARHRMPRTIPGLRPSPAACTPPARRVEPRAPRVSKLGFEWGRLARSGPRARTIASRCNLRPPDHTKDLRCIDAMVRHRSFDSTLDSTTPSCRRFALSWLSLLSR